MSLSPVEVQAIAALFRAGRMAEALPLVQALADRHPDSGFAWNALGAALGALGRNAEAVPALQQAARLLPQNAMVHSNLGAAVLGLERYGEAQASLERALAIDGRLTDALNNLGIALRKQGRIAEAIARFAAALQLRPDFADALNNLALAYVDDDRLDEAEAALRAACGGGAGAAPGSAGAWSNLGMVLRLRGAAVEAETCCQRALALDPGHAAARVELAIVLQELGRFAEATACCRAVIDAEPDNLRARSVHAFGLNFTAVAPLDRLDAARGYGKALRARAGEEFTQWACPPAPAALRVGLVSGDLREHAVGHFLEGILGAIDRGRLALFAYPSSFRQDALTQRLRPAFPDGHPNSPTCGHLKLPHPEGVAIPG